ncbi:hypothetical protein Pan216_53440 [Planctomycetes bacterium Pan216]|uniref:Serine/threonine-protein phosphatase 1 n=2 Tax=Kolteria novifilia TaxID=2527975 RepID=A0A518BBU0_9BACT|nr:hypothetical protein Pan216_53440 [Planctomycetes bacterium Pan216]
MALGTKCQLVCLKGNHEAAMLAALDGAMPLESWLMIGGLQTLYSYGPVGSPDDIPADHIEFLRECRLVHETDTHAFLHGNYDPKVPFDEQTTATLMWLSMRDHLPSPHVSGKTVVVGHTPQRSGDVLDLGYLQCIDTACVYGAYLTGLDVTTGKIWQVDRTGQRR